MSDRHEERLLNELLANVARADRELRAPASLETRVMSSWDHPVQPKRRPTALVAVAIAAALVLAVAVSLRHHEPVQLKERSDFGLPTSGPKPEGRSPEPAPQPAAAGSRQPRARAIRQPRVTQEVVDFIPLGPMPAADVSGSFQIVPVRINNAPAHLLLGEDGIAQGILWRSR